MGPYASGPANTWTAVKTWVQDRVESLLPRRDKGGFLSVPTDAEGTTIQPRKRTFMSAVYGWPPPKLDPSRETAWLDGLRGVAAFLVMTYHYHLEWWMFQLEAPYGVDPAQAVEIWRLPFLRLIMCAGHAQVSVFFVLSGFVLSWSPLSSIRSAKTDKLLATLSSATFRRWLRLYLPCFIVGFWSVLEFRTGIVFDMFIERPPTIWGQLWHYLKSCEKFSDPLHIDREERDFLFAYSWTMWTIPHEFAGSLLVFLIVLSIGRIPSYRRRTIVVTTVALYAMLKARWTYWLFTTGILLSDYIRHFGGFEGLTMKTGHLGRAIAIVVMIISLFLAGVPERSKQYKSDGYVWMEQLVPPNWRDIEAGGRWWWCWAGILFIVSASHLELARRFFAMGFCRYLGRISYMLYITHRLVYNAIGKPLRPFVSKLLMEKHYDEKLKADYYTGSAPVCTLRDVLCWIVLFPIAIFVAHWCEVLVDAPSVKFAKWVDEKFVNGFVVEKETVVHEEEMVSLTTAQETNANDRV